MKNLFRSFKKTTDAELKTLWKDAIFVFDTNVLHSVYRYKASTCEDVLKLMEQLQDRVWIPYHVALEFQRNRLSVISSQHKRFDETRTAIENAVKSLQAKLNELQLEKRHSIIDPQPLIEGINTLKQDYLKKLDEQENECLKVESVDPQLSRLESIFDSRIGPKPDNSEAIKEIIKEGRERYKSKIPPGYKDSAKESEPDNVYSYAGITYERQFGDLFVWKQLIQHVKAEKIKNVIFVTDDNKEDWWQITQGKTISFRYELIDEILRETDLVNFKAYSLLGFLNDATKYVEDSVSADTIEDISLNYNSEINQSEKEFNITDKEIANLDKVLDVQLNLNNFINQYNRHHKNIEENATARDNLKRIEHLRLLYPGVDFSFINKESKELINALDIIKYKIDETNSKIHNIKTLQNEVNSKELEYKYNELVNLLLNLEVESSSIQNKLNDLSK